MKAAIPSSSLYLTQLALGGQPLNPQGQTEPGKRTGSCFIHCLHTDGHSPLTWLYPAVGNSLLWDYGSLALAEQVTALGEGFVSHKSFPALLPPLVCAIP